MDTAAPAVRFESITKDFPGVRALDGVSLDVARGSCHALVGENGAGKSTLGKILAGLYAPDAGRVTVGGQPVRFHSPRDATLAGVAMVHQELLFCENLSVAENVLLGRMPRRFGVVNRRALHEEAARWLGRVGSTVDASQPLGQLPVSQQQLVQIAAAIAGGARILIFDEPTSSLTQSEARRLHELIDRLRADGATVLYVSHRLEEVFRLCDTVTVLRDGRHVATRPLHGFTTDTLVESMIGRPLDAYFPGHLDHPTGRELLRVEGLSSPGRFRDIAFTLRAGEVLGIAGLVGAGRTELLQALFGLDPAASGRVWIGGKEGRPSSPREAMRLGMGLIPEDRKRHGLVLPMGARENITLPLLARLARLGWVRRGEERVLVDRYRQRLRIRTPDVDTPAVSLSGGNQQKLVIARWVAAHCAVLLVDEPTRGVDVGAKAEIHGLIDELARAGVGVVLVSSELPEIANLSTRVLVLRHGRAAGQLARAEVTQDALMRLMAGIAG